MKAERRHHRERLIAKRRHYVVAFEDPTPTRLGKLARTACLCSCEMCRNPRRTVYAERTLAERRFYSEEIRSDV